MPVVIPDPSVPLVFPDGRVHDRWYPILKLWAAQFNTLTGDSESSFSALQAQVDGLDVLTTQGDIIVQGASAAQRLALGASGEVLQSNGTNLVYAALSSSVAAISAAAVTSAATLDIAVSSAYDLYEIDLINFAPATDNQSLYMRFSQSASFLSGASDYSWGVESGGAASADEADAQIVLGTTVGNGTNEVMNATIRIFRPGVSSFIKSALWTIGLRTGTPTSVAGNGGGLLLANTNALDGVQFLFASGNIASGYYAVRGYSFS